MADMRKKENKDLLSTVKSRFKVMVEADKENREEAADDIRFVNLPGAQWDENMKKLRGDRPCYEFNKVRVRCKRVVNDMRDNRPQGKVRAVEGGDKEIAEIYDGLIRNILNVSHADNATDYAAEYQVEGGMGAWRVNTAYADDSSFNQDIVIENVENPFCLYADNNAKDLLKRDADDWIYTERISHKEYERKYGSVAKVNFEGDGEFDEVEDWIDEETIRIAEYWYKVPHKKELWLIEVPDPDDPESMKTLVVDSESDEAEGLERPAKFREVETHKIMMCIASGEKIIEGPTEWAGHFFPWIMIYGEMKVIDGKRYWWGLPRFARDAQQVYNVAQTSISEKIASAPKEFDWATSTQAAGHVDEWDQAHKENQSFKIYNPDKAAPGPPVRVGPADIPVALMQQAQIADENIKDVMGLPDASMGKEGGEKSGRAIYARQQQGEISTFNYKDNHAKGVEYMHELLIDLIPEIYDTERELRVLGVDGKEDYKRVNTFTKDDQGNTVRVNDLATGKYDVTVTVGPNFSTLRQEAAETYGELGSRFPELMQFAGDLIFKSMDLPYADEIGDRLRAMLPPQIQQVIDKDEELPPEVEQAMRQVKQAMEQVQQHGQLVQAASQELEEQKALASADKADIRAELANVKAAKAEFDAHVAEQLLKLTQEGVSLKVAGADLKVKGAELKSQDAELRIQAAAQSEKFEGSNAMEAIGSIDETVARFMQVADQALSTLNDKAAGLENRTNRKIIGGETHREGAKLTAKVDYDDGSSKEIAAVRDKGGLKIVPE